MVPSVCFIKRVRELLTTRPLLVVEKLTSRPLPEELQGVFNTNGMSAASFSVMKFHSLSSESRYWGIVQVKSIRLSRSLSRQYIELLREEILRINSRSSSVGRSRILIPYLRCIWSLVSQSHPQGKGMEDSPFKNGWFHISWRYAKSSCSRSAAAGGLKCLTPCANAMS